MNRPQMDKNQFHGPPPLQASFTEVVPVDFSFASLTMQFRRALKVWASGFHLGYLTKPCGGSGLCAGPSRSSALSDSGKSETVLF
jgi:hypothetical protein